MAVPLTDAQRKVLEAPNYAHLATLMSDGSPQVSTIYYDYDARNLLQREHKDIQGFGATTLTNYYTYEYQKFDGYKEHRINGSSSYFQPGSTTTNYDVNGNIVSFSDQFAANRSRT